MNGEEFDADFEMRYSRPITARPDSSARSVDGVPHSRVLVYDATNVPDASGLLSTPPAAVAGPMVTDAVRRRLDEFELADLLRMEASGVPALPVDTARGVRWYRPQWLDT